MHSSCFYRKRPHRQTIEQLPRAIKIERVESAVPVRVAEVGHLIAGFAPFFDPLPQAFSQRLPSTGYESSG
jgi:hypothetical protein